MDITTLNGYPVVDSKPLNAQEAAVVVDRGLTAFTMKASRYVTYRVYWDGYGKPHGIVGTYHRTLSAAVRDMNNR